MYILFDILITVIVYLCVPVTLKYIFHKNYTYIQARNISIINSIIVCCFFILLRIQLGYEKSIISFAPAFIWGYVSYLILKPNSKSDTDDLETNQLIEVLEKNNKTENDNISAQDSNHKTSKNISINNNNIYKTKNKVINKMNTKSYKSSLISLIIVLIFVTIACMILLVYVFSLKSTLSFNNTKIINLNSQIRNLNSKITKYKEEYDDLKEKNEFMDDYIVIVSENTSIYHKYGCKYLDLTSFLVFNIDNAISQGYYPCSHCIK